MKVKLLKKIRKEFSVIHYPPGTYVYKYNEYNDEDLYYLKNKDGWISMREELFRTKEDALKQILIYTYMDYGKYSVKNKKKNKKIKKVWW